MRRFRIGLLILNTLMLSACSLPKPSSRDGAEASASFFIEHSEVKSTTAKMIPGFSVPASKTFHFKACLRDLKRSQTLINQAFSVEGDSKKLDLSTNADGCLEWDEEFAYNHFSEARFVAIERSLTGESLQKGTKILKYAINPWENIAYDIDKNEVPNVIGKEDSEAALRSYNTNYKTLIAADIQMNIIERKNSDDRLDLRMEMRTQPLIEVKKSSNEVLYDPLQEGKFRATLHLYHVVVENDKEIRTEVFQSEKIDTLTFKGQISIKFPISLKEICTRGQYYLGLNLEPNLPPPYKLKTFEGIYFVSECDAFKNNFFTRLSTEAYERGNKFSLDEYVKETPIASTPSTLSGGTASQGNQGSGYFVSELRPDIVGYKDSTSVERNLNMRFRACLNSRFDKKALSGYDMEITKMDGSVTHQMSFNDGCFNWDDTISYHYLGQECESIKVVSIRNTKIGLNYTTQLLINPWSGLVRDLKINKDAGKNPPRCADGKSFIFANMYEWKKSTFSYEVDPFLNLTVKKTGVLSIRLFVNRSTLAKDESGTDKVEAPIGDYRMQMALVKNGTDSANITGDDILMLKDTIMHINSRSEIADYFTFENREFKDFGNLTQTYLVITPVSNSENFEPRLYRGDYNLGETFEGASLARIPDADGNQFMTQLRNRKAEFDKKQAELYARQATKETMQKELGLRIMNLNKPAETQILRNSLSTVHKNFFLDFFKSSGSQATPVDQKTLGTLVTTGSLSRELAEKLCTYWIRDYLEYPWPRIKEGSLVAGSAGLKQRAEFDCVRNVKNGAAGYFDLQIRDLVKNPKVVEARDGVFQDFSISNGYSLGFARAHADTTSFGWDVNGGLSFKFWEVASAGGGVRYSSSHSDSDSTQHGTQISFNGQINTTIETLSLHVKAEATERCLIIKVKPEFYMQSYWTKIINPKLTAAEKVTILRSGLALCEGEWSKDPKDLVENYYVINQAPKTGQILDPNSSKNRPFFMSVRGDNDYGAFLSYFFDGHNVPDTHKKDFQIKNLMKSREKDLFLRDMPSSPGQIISTP